MTVRTALPASLSGTFLQRKDVVNQCSESGCGIRHVKMEADTSLTVC